MSCCSQCQGIESVFSKRMANGELKEYRRKGPSKTTQQLLDFIKKQDNIQGKTLLDIGGGVGAIQHKLVEAGVDRVTNVDASSAYLNTARAEATRLGYVDKASYHAGDFVDLAPTIDAADVVTLDRVLCCYPEALTRASISG